MPNDFLEAAETDAAGGGGGAFAAPSSGPGNPFLDAALDDQQSRTVRRNATLQQAMGVKPDTYAAQRRIAGQLGYPPAAVEAQPEQAAQTAQLQQINQDTAKSPVLAQKYTDEDFAKLAHDDSPVLGKIGDALIAAGKYAFSAPDSKNTLMGDVGAGVAGVSSGGYGTFRAAAELAAPALDPITGPGTRENPLRYLAAAFGELSAQGNQLQKELSPPSASLLQGGVSSGVQSLVQSAMAIPLSLVNPAAGLTMLAGVQGGNAYQEGRKQGLNPVQALPFAMLQGTIEYATEKLPMHALLKDIGAGSSLLKTFGRQIATDMPGEQIATALQDMNEWAVLPENKDKPFKDYLADRPAAAIQTAIATVVAGGGNAAIAQSLQGITVSAVQDQLQQEQAQRGEKAMGDLFALAAQSKLRERSPETFQQFVQETADANPNDETPSEVYIDARTLVGENGTGGLLNQEEIAQHLPSVHAQLSEALATGGAVSVPIGELMSLSDTGKEKAITEHLRTSEDGISAFEAKEAAAQAQVFAQSAQKAVDEATDRTAVLESQEKVKQTVLAELNAAGRFTPEVHDAYATLVGNFYGTMAARAGVTPEEMYSKYPLRVQASGIGGLNQGAPQTEDEYIARINPEGRRIPDSHRPIEMAADMEGMSAGSRATLIKAYRVKDVGNVKIMRDAVGGVFATVKGKEVGYMAPSGVSDTVLSVAQEFQGKGIGTLISQHYRTMNPYALSGGLTEGGEKTARAAFRYMRANGYLQGNGAPRATFNPDTLTISLLEKADLSSFLHEGGHAFLEIMTDMASQPGAPAEIASDMGKVLDWFGIKGDSTATKNEPPLKTGFVRVYHSGSKGEGQTGLWVSTQRTYASNYRSDLPLHYLDLPADDSRVNNVDYPEQGVSQGFTFNFELTPAESARLIETSRDSAPTALDTWNAMTLDQKRKYHERFAESFEQFLFEGKAPSQGLQPLFQRFRAWMTNVYRSLTEFMRSHDTQLSPEVRQIFDRMLASDDAIRQAEEQRRFAPLFKSAEEAGMKPEAWAAYQALSQDATDAAVAALQKRSLRDLRYASNARNHELKRLQAEQAAKRKAVTAEVTPQVQAEPVYQAQQWLRKGEMTTPDGEAIKAEKGFRLSTEALAEMYPEASPLVSTTKPISFADASALLKGKTEKSGGTDPTQHLHEGANYRIGRVPLSLFADNEDGALYDSTVNAERAADYAKRDGASAPAVIAAVPKKSPDGKLRILDGGHRISAARQRGDTDILAVVNVRDTIPPNAEAPNLERLKGMTAKNGMHPDMVAGVFGYSSGDEMVRAIVDAQPIHQVIEATVDQRMLERYGDLATVEGAERAADEAVHNDVRARFVATELTALQKGVGKVNVMIRAAKDYAASLVAARKVRDLRPGQHKIAETKAAKAALSAMSKGDTKAAITAKRDQLLQHYAARATDEALDEIDGKVKYLRRVAESESLPAEYREQIETLLERFDLKEASLKAIDKRKSLAAWVKSQEDLGIEPDLPPGLLDESLRQNYKDMTVEAFRGLVDAVKQIEHLGRLKNKLLTSKDQREFEAVRDEIASSVDTNAGKRKADTRTPTTNAGRFLDALKRFGAAHVKVATWARVFDGGKAGPVWEYLVRPANERADQEATMRADATQKLSDIMADFMSEKTGGKGKFFPSIGRSLNRESVLTIALNTGNAGNLQRLLGGEGWTRAQLEPVLQSLTTRDWQTVQAVWDHFDSYRPEIAAKQRRVYGTEPDWVEPTPFTVTTSNGGPIDVKGGYYPIKYDSSASIRAEEHADADGAKRQLQGAYGAATTRRSFTKSRAEEVTGRPLLYTLAGMYSGVNDVIHDLAWHEWLIDANRLLRSEAIDRSIREHYGPAAVQQFKSWRDAIAEGDTAVNAQNEQFAGWLRKNVSAAGIAFNIKSALLQPLGITQSIVRIGAAPVARGVKQYIANPVKATREVNSKSTFMANRARTRFRELNELRNRVQNGQSKADVARAYGYWLMMRVQQTVDTPTWLGAFDKAVTEGNDDRRAVALADQAVRDSQGGGQTHDLSAIERGGQAWKLFTVFYGFMNTTTNLAVAATMTDKSKVKLAADYLMLFTVPTVLMALLKDAITPGDSGDYDDWKKISRKMISAQIDQLLGLMVGTREFAEAAKIATGDHGRDYAGPAGVRMIGDLQKFVGQAQQGEMDDAFRKAAVNLSGDFLGVPAAQVNNSITGVKALNEGKTDNPFALLFGHQEKH